MVDFTLTEEQAAMQKMARDFAQKHNKAALSNDEIDALEPANGAFADRPGYAAKKGVKFAASLLRNAYDASKWHKAIVNKALPVLAVGMAKAIVAQMLTIGVDIRKGRRKQALIDDSV
jgi:hypothetical protein